MDEREVATLFWDETLLKTGQFEEILTWLYCSVSGSEYQFDPIKHLDWIGEARAEFSLGNIDVFLHVVKDFRDYSLDIEEWDTGQVRTPATTRDAYINELLISDIKLVRVTCEAWLRGELPKEFDAPVKLVLNSYMKDPKYLEFPKISKVIHRGRKPIAFDDLLLRLKTYWDVVNSEDLSANNDGVSIAAKKVERLSAGHGVDAKAFRKSMIALLGKDWKKMILNQDHPYHFIVKEVISRMKN